MLGDLAHIFACYLKTVTLVVEMSTEMGGKVEDVQTMVMRHSIGTRASRKLGLTQQSLTLPIERQVAQCKD